MESYLFDIYYVTPKKREKLCALNGNLINRKTHKAPNHKGGLKSMVACLKKLAKARKWGEGITFKAAGNQEGVSGITMEVTFDGDRFYSRIAKEAL